MPYWEVLFHMLANMYRYHAMVPGYFTCTESGSGTYGTTSTLSSINATALF